jgi:HK97 family phage major capsid protein
MATTYIQEQIKKAFKQGNAEINLKEASNLTGSGSGIGGRTIYDDAFASLRLTNPIRYAGARVITTIGSDEAFVAKTGNITNIQSGSNNPWGYYPINANNAGTGLNTCYWQQPVQAIQAWVPLRTALIEDINAISDAIMSDIMMEFSQQEALSMMFNNDQAGSTTVNYGATSGLRGLNSYSGSTSSASFGTTGSAITNGLHTIKQVLQTGASITYNDVVSVANALPPQYWNDSSTCWMMHPTTILQLRELTSSTGQPLFVEVGDQDGGAVAHVFGFRVVPNSYMDVTGSGKFPIYLAAWDKFVTIADNELMNIQTLEQTYPGFITVFAEKRVVSTVRDVFAGVRLTY